MSQFSDIYDYRRRTLVDRAGDKIGTVEDIHPGRAAGAPQWLLVRIGLLGARKRLVPLRGATPRRECIEAAVSRRAVRDAPDVPIDRALSEADERRLLDHYAVASPPAEAEVTRSEEEVRVGTRKRAVGRVRLRKYVVTEHVQMTVPVQREEVRLQHEPVDDDEVDRRPT
jgi:Domain of unknown function (DUF2382)